MSTWGRLRAGDRRTLEDVAIISLLFGAPGSLFTIIDDDTEHDWVTFSLLALQCAGIIVVLLVRRRRERPARRSGAGS